MAWPLRVDRETRLSVPRVPLMPAGSSPQGSAEASRRFGHSFMKRAQLLLALVAVAVALALGLADIVQAAGFQARQRPHASVVDFDMKVIANNSIGASDISIDDIKAVFLLTKTTLDDGGPVEPVLATSGTAHASFLGLVGKTDASLTAYLRTLVFTGKASMPKTCNSDAEMVAYVSKTTRTIGYVTVSAASAGTKTLTIK